MTFPSASFTDSRPSTFRSCSKEMRFFPTETYFFAQPYSRIAYWLRSPILAGFWETYSGRRFFDSSQMRSKCGLNVNVDFLIFRSPRLDGFQPPGVAGNDFVTLDLVDAQSIIAHQPQRRFEQLFTSDQNRLRLTGSIFLKTDVEHVALGIGQHEIAFLDSGRERFGETFTDYVFWSRLLNSSFGFSHFQYLRLLLVINPAKRTGSFPLLHRHFEEDERLAFQRNDFRHRSELPFGSNWATTLVGSLN